MSARASVLVYNTDQLTPADLPASLLDLAKPEWKGRFGFPPSETDFQPLVTAVATLKGEDAAKQWLEGLKDNGKTYDNNEAIIAAVNRGEIAAGLIEHYYWYRLRNEIPADQFHVALHYFPRGDPGHLLVVSGAGVLTVERPRGGRPAVPVVPGQPGRPGDHRHQRQLRVPAAAGRDQREPRAPVRRR